jgi:hypothetical protein
LLYEAALLTGIRAGKTEHRENRAYGKQSIAGQAWDEYGRLRSMGESGGLSEFLPESVICDTGTGGF